MNHPLVIIPARSGSKGIRHKNLQRIGSKSLIHHAIDHALQLVPPEYIIFSSDSHDYIQHVYDINPRILCRIRPSHLSLDDSTALYTWRDCVHHFDSTQSIDIKYSIYLEPSSPFRSLSFLKTQYSNFLQSTDDLRYSVSVTDSKYSFEKQILLDESSRPSALVVDNNDYFTQKQHVPTTYHKNGVFYMAKNDHILNSDQLFSGNQTCSVTPFEVVNIDTQADLAYARFLFNLK